MKTLSQDCDGKPQAEDKETVQVNIRLVILTRLPEY